MEKEIKNERKEVKKEVKHFNPEKEKEQKFIIDFLEEFYFGKE